MKADIRIVEYDKSEQNNVNVFFETIDGSKRVIMRADALRKIREIYVHEITFDLNHIYISGFKPCYKDHIEFVLEQWFITNIRPEKEVLP